MYYNINNILYILCDAKSYYTTAYCSQHRMYSILYGVNKGIL